MIIDPRSTPQSGIRTLEQHQKELLAKVSVEAEARIIKTVDVLIKGSAPLSHPQRQSLESNSANLSNSIKALLQNPVLYLIELDVEGKPTLSISPTPLAEGSKFTAQLKALLNELTLTQPAKTNTSSPTNTNLTNNLANHLTDKSIAKSIDNTNSNPGKPSISHLIADKTVLPVLTNALREALPKQTPQVIRQTLVTAELINKLPPAVGETLVSKPTQQLLKQLESFPSTPAQLKDSSTLQAALKNSGVFLEHQLAQTTRPITPNKDSAYATLLSNQQAPSASQTQVESLLNAPTRERLLHAWRNLVANIAANKQAGAPAQTHSEKTPKPAQPNPDNVIKPPPSSATKNDTVPTSDLKGLLLNLKASLEKNDLPGLLAKQRTANASNTGGKLSAENIPGLLKTLLSLLTNTSSNKMAGANNNQTQQQIVNLVYQQVLFSLARIQHQQLQSLINNPRQGSEPNATPLTHLNIELPIKFMDQPHTVNVDIEEDWVPDDNEQKENNTKTKQWKVTLYFDLPEAGGFYAQLLAIAEKVSVKFWADRPETLAAAKGKLEALKASLTAHGVTVNDAQCVKGTPPKKTSRLEYSLVDITT